MKIPKYWAQATQTLQDTKGKTFALSCWRWSDVSVAEAREQARERIAEIARKLQNNEDLNRYSYGERPLREEIVQEIVNPHNERIAVITRNAYGAMILNAARVMFIDIDIEQPKKAGGLATGIKQLFGKAQPNPEAQALERMEEWVGRHPERGLRAYRTKAGLRCLVTHDVFDPTLASTGELLRSFESDPLYTRLCHDQGCFRARLTPKPWRCGVPLPPSKYPWEDAKAELSYRRWERQYETMSQRYGVCQLIEELGSRESHPDVAVISATHDRYTCAAEGLSLA